MSTGVNFPEAWIHRRRRELQNRYGAGTYVAVYDCAVIDWGNDREQVRERAENLIGDTVFVGPVPAEPPDDYTTEDHDAAMAEYRRYRALADANPDRRRFRLPSNLPGAFERIGELDITGRKTEFVDGVVVIDGVERRYAEHDYRLMVEHGLVPKDTELIAGIIFRKKPRETSDKS